MLTSKLLSTLVMESKFWKYASQTLVLNTAVDTDILNKTLKKESGLHQIVSFQYKTETLSFWKIQTFYIPGHNISNKVVWMGKMKITKITTHSIYCTTLVIDFSKLGENTV